LQLLRRKGWLGLGDCCTDLYVIGQFGLAAVAYVLSFWVSWTYVVNLALGALVIFYSGWRIIELVAFFLMQMIGGKPEVASRERSFVLALLNYFEVTFWFAVWYSVLVRCGSLKITNSYPSGLSIFRESLAMMLVNSSNTFELTVSWWLWTAVCSIHRRPVSHACGRREDCSLAAAIKGSHEAHLTLYTREHDGWAAP
jgi:hypothetical protein